MKNPYYMGVPILARQGKWEEDSLRPSLHYFYHSRSLSTKLGILSPLEYVFCMHRVSGQL